MPIGRRALMARPRPLESVVKPSRWTTRVSSLALALAAALAAGLPGTSLAQDVFDDDPPEGTALTANELEATGRTMESGKHLVSVLGRYRYGATDWFQVGTNGWEWIGGPNVNVGFTAYADDKHAISIEIDSMADYSFGTKTASANLIYSLGPAVGSRFNAGLAFSWQAIQSEVEVTFNDDVVPDPDPIDISGRIVGVPLHLGYDLAVNDVQMVRFWFNPYVYYASTSEADILTPPIFPYSGGVAYYRGYEQFRIGAGLTASNLGLDILRELEALALSAGEDVPAVPDVLPMPFIRLYWLL